MRAKQTAMHLAIEAHQDKVEAKHPEKRGRLWFPARIEKENDDKTFHVIYDDETLAPQLSLASHLVRRRKNNNHFLQTGYKVEMRLPDGLEWHKVLIPYFQADLFILKIVRNRIADHQQIDITLAHQADFFSLAGEPPFGDARCRDDGLVLRRRSRLFGLRFIASCRRGRQDGYGKTQRQANATIGDVFWKQHDLYSYLFVSVKNRFSNLDPPAIVG